jgi:hypothetical protein
MRDPSRKVVPLQQVPGFLFEMHSERMVDALLALEAAGFEVTSVINTNRYRIEDSQEKSK